MYTLIIFYVYFIYKGIFLEPLIERLFFTRSRQFSSNYTLHIALLGGVVVPPSRRGGADKPAPHLPLFYYHTLGATRPLTLDLQHQNTIKVGVLLRYRLNEPNTLLRYQSLNSSIHASLACYYGSADNAETPTF